MKRLKIPDEHFDKFVYFLSLPKAVQNKISIFLDNAPIGTLPEDLINIASKEIEELSKENLHDILLIYFNLSSAKENFSISLNELIDLLAIAFTESKITELSPSDQTLSPFKELLSGNSNAAKTSKVLETMNENTNTYTHSTIYQDVRPVFDNNSNFLGSVIINNLKVEYSTNNTIKEMFISLDKDDIDELISKLKSAKEKISLIKKNVNGKSILDI